MTKTCKQTTFIKVLYLIGFIWLLIGCIIAYDQRGGYGRRSIQLDPEELLILCLTPLVCFSPLIYYFFIQSRTLEILPGFIGLYFKRRRIEEEKKIKELGESE